ncbi:MAG: protease HtpX [Steroidobacteraceae bacterium]
MKRLVLFLLTNIAVLVLLTIIVRATGADAALAARGMDWRGLLLFAAVIGFAGSLISLALSKWQAKTFMGVRVIAQPQTETESWLLETVREHASRVGIAMPEVGIYDGAEMNAFATGASRNHALVAVSSGLLRGMTPEEAHAVLGHEITHAANGDMVTLALIQGVVNTFVIFLSRVLGTLLDSFISGGRTQQRRGPGPFYFVTVIVLQVVLGLFANIIVMGFSRRREFRADAGGARLDGTGNMIAALERLHAGEGAALPGSLRAFGISGDVARGLKRLFMSHPPIPERIAALREGRYANA